MAINYKEIVQEIFKIIGKDYNISSYTNCQTRLRINVVDIDKINKNKLENLQGVLGVNITGNQVQLIFGTGKVIKAINAFSKLTSIPKGELADTNKNDINEITKQNKKIQKEKNQSFIQKFLGKFSGIFAPMILGFIGAGILSGIGSILKSSGLDSFAATSWINFLSVLLTIWKATFLIIVGWRTAEAFSGSGVIGAIIAGLYIAGYSGSVNNVFQGRGGTYSFLGIHISDPMHNWLTLGLRPSQDQFVVKLSYPSGSVFGVMFSAGIVGIIEKYLRKFIPTNLDTVLTPTLSLIILLFLNFFLIIPASGYVFTGVSFAFKNLYGNPFGAALLAGVFLVTVVFGIHQGFVPVYSALIVSTGVNGLFPILAMAGGGQVGMAMALWLRGEKDGKLRNQIQGAIIPAFLGIGEPLIYGVSLPRVKPFITAMLGGAVGGFVMGAWNLWASEPVGLNTMFGPSGLLALGLMTTPSGSVLTGVLVYLTSLFVTYLSGFIITYFFGHKKVDLK